MNRTEIQKRWMALLGCLGLALFDMLSLVGCGSAKGAASGPAQYYGNYHPLGWIDGTNGQKAHGMQAVASIGDCTKCHEISILKVGSGVPTCMTSGCHHKSTPGFATPAVHGLRAKLATDAAVGGSLVSCQICHGKDFSGGGAANACSSCHGVSAPHPRKLWRGSGGSVFTHTDTHESNAAACAQCHFPGSPNNPDNQHPLTPAPAGTQPGCYNNTLCHGANAAPHAPIFYGGLVDTKGNGHLNATATTFDADCKTCHAYSGASPLASAPLCNACHLLADPIAAGTGEGTCLSCHVGVAGLNDGPGGTVFPSIAGAHATHMGLPSDNTMTCSTCHAGFESNSHGHYDKAQKRRSPITAGPAPVVMDPIFTPKSGGLPVFTGVGASGTCSNVSCHGGQTPPAKTPDWQTGKINSNDGAQCVKCHAIAAAAGTATQWNDAFGRHSQGSHNATTGSNGVSCTTCHDMTKHYPSPHFSSLTTANVTGSPSKLPSGTIVFDPTFVSGNAIPVYNVTATGTAQGNGGCALSCHLAATNTTHLHSGAPVFTWQSSATGAPHDIPFLSTSPVTTTGQNGHMTVTLAGFNADCKSCHSHVAPSPMAGAPVCSSCHTLFDPTIPAYGTGTCLSCHEGTPGLPVGPTGTTFPNVAGAHSKHMGLAPNTPMNCDSCHATYGTGTVNHYNYAKTPTANPAPVKINPIFNAQSGGAATFPASAAAPRTCSNVSCHGGQVTPDWRTAASINSLTQCSACHAINSGTASAQYNDAVGKHASGTHNSAAKADCTICHKMDPALYTTVPGGVTNHFAALDQHSVTGPTKLPSSTIFFKTTTNFPITGTMSYTTSPSPLVEGDGGCALACHSLTSSTVTHVPSANHWKGSGAAHPLPFYSGDLSTQGFGHQTVTSAQFDQECATCHDRILTAGSTKSGPNCTKCHTAADPTSAGKGAPTCLSCHPDATFKTLGPAGTTFPNIGGAHTKHLQLLTPLTCVTCHLGYMPGDTNNTHYKNASKTVATPVSAGPAPVAMDATTFKPKTSSPAGAAPSFTIASQTCSNVSCHGAQVTPVWPTGHLPAVPVAATATVETYCTACHAAGTAQYNSWNSSRPKSHHSGALCTDCHYVTTGAGAAQTNHWNHLDTPAMEGPASGTIQFLSPAATGARTYSGNQCTLTCHFGGNSQNHNPETW